MVPFHTALGFSSANQSLANSMCLTNMHKHCCKPRRALTSHLLLLILQGSQPQQAPDATQIDRHAAAQQHENQPPTQTEVSTGSASLAAASGLLAIAGTAGKCKPGQVLGSSESDGTPHPEHSTPSAGPPSPHMRRQQQQQQAQTTFRGSMQWRKVVTLLHLMLLLTLALDLTLDLHQIWLHLQREEEARAAVHSLDQLLQHPVRLLQAERQ